MHDQKYLLGLSIRTISIKLHVTEIKQNRQIKYFFVNLNEQHCFFGSSLDPGAPVVRRKSLIPLVSPRIPRRADTAESMEKARAGQEVPRQSQALPSPTEDLRIGLLSESAGCLRAPQECAGS